MNKLQRHFTSLSSSYQEHADSNFTHRGKKYFLNPLFDIAQKRPLREMDVKELEWVLEYDTPDPARKKAADLNAPILVVYEPEYGKEKYTVVDGLHRLAKAVEENVKVLPAKVLTMEDLAKAKKLA